MAHWNINSVESFAYQYTGDPALYAPHQYRSSDHDPLVLGIDLEERCFGLLPTIERHQAAETPTGTNKRDVIMGLGGNDQITGGNGDDVICGGAGDDVVNGDNGNDVMLGGFGDDVLAAPTATTSSSAAPATTPWCRGAAESWAGFWSPAAAGTTYTLRPVTGTAESCGE